MKLFSSMGKFYDVCAFMMYELIFMIIAQSLWFHLIPPVYLGLLYLELVRLCWWLWQFRHKNTQMQSYGHVQFLTFLLSSIMKSFSVLLLPSPLGMWCPSPSHSGQFSTALRSIIRGKKKVLLRALPLVGGNQTQEYFFDHPTYLSFRLT